MAHSRNIQKGQFRKVCDLCETYIEVNWKCINCNILMCKKCKEKVHSKFKSDNKHKVIDIKELGHYTREFDLTNFNCEDHEGQTCVMFCKSCDLLVCPRCIAEVHNSHGTVQIKEGFKIQIENVKNIQQQIKSQIEKLINIESKLKLLRKDESSKYTETRNLIQAQNAALKREVDKYTKKLIKELDQKWETLQNYMTEEEHKITAVKTTKKDQKAKTDEIINSNDAYRVFKESKQMGKFMKEALEPVNSDLSTITIPKFLPGEITECNFGSLQDISINLVFNIHQAFRTDIDKVYFLSACPDNSLWISHEKVIQRVKIDGSNLKVMTNFNMEIYGMALTPSNDLLLVTNKTSRLEQISSSSEQVTDSVYSVDPFRITSVHVTSDYKVFVGAMRSPGPGFPVPEPRIVIRMNKEGKHEKTYEYNKNKQPFFTYVRHITSTTNGTIFVVDWLQDDGTGRIVVIGHNSDVLNTYTGHPRINSDAIHFKPMYAGTTPLNNIIVTDLDTNTIHILNSVGHLITYYNTSQIGIIHPFSLSFTTAGQLYVGCSTAEDSTDRPKLYEVDISHI